MSRTDWLAEPIGGKNSAESPEPASFTRHKVAPVDVVAMVVAG